MTQPASEARPNPVGRKILIGIAVVVVLVAAGVFGMLFWMEQRIQREIASVFDALRTHLASATHGPVAINRWTRTATINDIALQPKGPSSPLTKIGRLVLTGASSSASDEFSARKIELADTSIASGSNSGTIGLVTIEDLNLAQSRQHLPELIRMAFAQPPAPQPTAREVLEKAAALVEQLRFGKLEVRNVTQNVQAGTVTLAAFRSGRFEKGAVSELAYEGLSFPKNNGKLGALVFRSLDLARVLRKSAAWSILPQGPQAHEMVEMFTFLHGFELRDFVLPKTDLKKKAPSIEIRQFQASWGQFVGFVPTKSRATLRASASTDAGEPAIFKQLASLGLPFLVLHYDLGSEWSEKTQVLEGKPITIELEKLFSLSGSMTWTNVPRRLFEVDPMTSDPLRHYALVEPGRIALSFRDDGVVTFGIAEFARNLGVTPDIARKVLIEQLDKDVLSKFRSSPEMVAIVAAIQQLMKEPGSTLTLALTPKARVNFNQLVEQFKIDPGLALSNFNVEANVKR